MKVLPISIKKRDGSTVQDFDPAKLKQAITKAWVETLGSVDEKRTTKIVNTALSFLNEGEVTVEEVQDAVELALMHDKQFAVAKCYIIYRHERAEARQSRTALKPDPKAVSDYIHAAKYARYRPELQRREVYTETVARVEEMHTRRFPQLETEIKEAFDLVREKRVLPSMRSMQFAGAAIEQNHCRIYNCSFTLIDRWEVFSQILYLLLCGCGVGYSVQFDHVEALSEVKYIDKKKVRHHVVGDTVEGWADALNALVQSYQDGVNLEFSYHLVRDAGTPLKTSGGVAPGHLKLKESLERIRAVLERAQGRKLRPIECHRIVCHAADAVLSGGIRRSSCICLFSLDDSELLYAKTGNWFETDPWFANANNSVMLKRDEMKKKQFKRVFEMIKQWGEPGFFFTDNYNTGANPCVEIGLDPVLVVTPEVQARAEARGYQAKIGAKLTGFGFCNLCEMNAAKFASLEDFIKAAKAATFIGTLQASYTDMPYLGWVTEEIVKRDALLGIGMTGMMDAPHIACNPEFQREVAGLVVQWNIEFAAKTGVRSAARLCCIKPSGTSSLELGCVASGHHPHHGDRIIRRVTADELERLFQEFKRVNPHMCVRKPDGKWVIEFPVEAPQGALLRENVGAVEFLSMVKSTQQNWVLPGTARSEDSPGLTHNVSNTVTVRDHEWEPVSEYLWSNREFFTGVSMLPYIGDKKYAFAPMEAVVTREDEKRWCALIESYKPVDYQAFIEGEDGTDLIGEVACAGGLCLI